MYYRVLLRRYENVVFFVFVDYIIPVNVTRKFEWSAPPPPRPTAAYSDTNENGTLELVHAAERVEPQTEGPALPDEKDASTELHNIFLRSVELERSTSSLTTLLSSAKHFERT